MAVRKKTKKSAPDPVDEVKAEVREAALPSGPDSPAEGETHGQNLIKAAHAVSLKVQRHVAESRALKGVVDRIGGLQNYEIGRASCRERV